MSILTGIIGFIVGVLLSILIAIFGIFGFILPGSSSVESGEPTGSYTAYAIPVLVEPMWVSLERAANPDLVIVAVASASDFEAGHIEGAIRIDPADIEVAGTEEPGWQFDLESLLGENGISADSTVVVYDYGDANASRLWWALTRLSHPAVGVLDGGFAAWQANEFDTIEGSSPPPTVARVYYGILNDAVIASTEDVEAALDDSGFVIIDARSESEFASGHIPGAINIPADANFRPDGALLPVEDLFALYEAAGITPDKQVIVYCQSGLRSTNTALALTSLGYWSVQIYTESWPGWISDPTRPVED